MRTLIPELGVQSERNERDGGWNSLKHLDASEEGGVL